jgi:hypothetical protein
MPKEPNLVINGHVLSDGQTMTFRVALETFVISLQKEGLGEDDTGKAITEGYLNCAKEIRRFMFDP